MTAGEPGQDPNDTADPRLRSLDERLRTAHQAEAARAGKHKRATEGKGYSQGNRVLAELIAGPAGGALVGWVIDRLAGTAPWGLLVAMILGIAVAFRNIIRISNERPE